VTGLRLASQRVMARVAAELGRGAESWFTALGTSMTPEIRAVQRVRLRPVRPREALVGLVVLAEVGGRFWLHRVTQERPGEVHIAGDNGFVNGWTPRESVFGVLC
jgi:hypothetical protein